MMSIKVVNEFVYIRALNKQMKFSIIDIFSECDQDERKL